ncbi:hypothetical protein DMC47_20810 [Nostoc sp. 3335mG]|nr:hypothetical protein DMC47_20810 [Nostoc sp. 3335mG]
MMRLECRPDIFGPALDSAGDVVDRQCLARMIPDIVEHARQPFGRAVMAAGRAGEHRSRFQCEGFQRERAEPIVPPQLCGHSPAQGRELLACLERRVCEVDAFGQGIQTIVRWSDQRLPGACAEEGLRVLHPGGAIEHVTGAMLGSRALNLLIISAVDDQAQAGLLVRMALHAAVRPVFDELDRAEPRHPPSMSCGPGFCHCRAPFLCNHPASGHAFPGCTSADASSRPHPPDLTRSQSLESFASVGLTVPYVATIMTPSMACRWPRRRLTMTVVIPPDWQQPRAYSELNYLRSRNLVIVSRRASGSFVARSLGIGFNEAMNHLDRMERAGVISAADERGVRSVLARPPDLEPDEAGKA